MALPAIETGDGVAGPLAGSWTQWDAASTLDRDGAGNLVAASAARHIAYWNADQFFEDQYGRIVCGTTPTGSDFYNIVARASGEGATAQGYWIYVGATNGGLQKTLAGADAGVVSFDGLGVVAGDVIELQMVGPQLQVFVNTVLRATYTDPSPIADGAVGAGVWGTGAKIASWAGGNIGGPPPEEPPPDEPVVGGAAPEKRKRERKPLPRDWRARLYEERAEIEEAQRIAEAEAAERKARTDAKQKADARKARKAAADAKAQADALEKEDEEFILNFLMERL